ncbi:hypothetical protein E4U14_004604 [Claviceps sp. LM454 group G7]|nr:hypothetical protein E4U14_004604 [Claviceps sp. LM454 group G7]
MSTPPQETGNSNDIQGATHQTNPDIFLGPRPQNFRPQRLGTSCQKVYAFTSLDSGSTPVTVSQDADRLISEIYRDRDHVVQIDSFRAIQDTAENDRRRGFERAPPIVATELPVGNRVSLSRRGFARRRALKSPAMIVLGGGILAVEHVVPLMRTQSQICRASAEVVEYTVRPLNPDPDNGSHER